MWESLCGESIRVAVLLFMLVFMTVAVLVVAPIRWAWLKVRSLRGL
jgi:hypothetical protein